MFDPIGFAYILKFGISNENFRSVRNLWNFQKFTIVKFRFVWIPCGKKQRLFWPQKVIPELPNIWNFPERHFMLCNRYLYHISKHPWFFYRYWCNIHDFWDFIRRIFGIVRCPSFKNDRNVEVQICNNHMF